MDTAKVRKKEVEDESFLESQIGDTPLIRLHRITKDLSAKVEVYAKAEHLNPGGSVKDRAALAMILDAEKRGVLTKDKTILDATSGNTGIAYAMIAAARGYKLTLTLPANASPERKKILKIYGAKIIETDPMSGTDASQIKAKELVEEFPEKYVYLDQYNNEANWQAHYNSTANEIWQQTKNRITHFVAGLGTTGTFIGTSRKLKEINPKIKTISIQPDSPLHGLEGMKHLETAIVPGIYDAKIADKETEVETEDAFGMTKKLAKEEGLFVGVSAGANVFAAVRLARELSERNEPAVIVTVLCDGGGKYLSENFWE